MEEIIKGEFNRLSYPSQLKITDIRFTDVVDAPMHCTLMKIYTNQGIVGLGEVRDGGNRVFAEMLKSRILGENPCNVEKIFRRIRQFGGPARQGGGVCGIEVALWDLAGKAWGVPTVGCLWGIGGREELEEAGADLLVSSFAELQGLLLGGGGGSCQKG